MDKQNFSVDKLLVNQISGASLGSLPTPGDKFYIDPTYGSDGNDGNEKSPIKTLKTAYAGMESLKNDVAYIYPGSSGISLSATTTSATGTFPNITKSLCSFIGTSNQKMSQRSRIGMSTTFTPMLRVSGYGNTFANLYFQHGTATTDSVGIDITGNYNSFYNCHIATPLFAALGDQAAYVGLNITATGTYFKECVIGMNTIARTGAYPTVSINAPSTKYGYTRFDDCTFLMQGGASVVHMLVDNTAVDQDEVFVEINRCRFISTNANMAAGPTYSFSFVTTAAAGCTCAVMLDPTCQFINSGLTTVNNYSNLWIPTAAKTAAAITSALVAAVE